MMASENFERLAHDPAIAMVAMIAIGNERAVSYLTVRDCERMTTPEAAERLLGVTAARVRAMLTDGDA